MRICIIIPEFVTELQYGGGISQRFYRIAKWEVEQGHTVHVIVNSYCNQNFEKEGIFVHRICIKHSVFLKLLRCITFGRLNGAVYWLVFSFCALRLVKYLHASIHFDIVHSVSYHACGLFSLLFTKIPHVLSVSSYRPVWNKAMGVRVCLDVKALEAIENLYLRLNKNIYVSSKSLEKLLVQKLGLKNIEVIHPPFYIEIKKLDDAFYREYLGEKPYLLFFGQISSHKGAHILAQALPEVFVSLPELHAVFVGSDTSASFGFLMQEYITSKNSSYKKRLIFIDKCSHDKLYPIVQHARLVVLPSLVDNFPNTLIEAMGWGKPVIGTIGCSFEEVIKDGENGFLVFPANAEALAKKIIEVWSRPDLGKIGEAAKRKIQDFAPDKTIKVLLDYFNRVAAKGVKKNDG
ncbi:MAG: glycosyltransferase family 4 protein [Candidatus Omnitrophica bacterium]|nr:glycosyltransferase family 4 protein [Candidatus Omnitrophota bacterium]MDD5429305.1 glycosyltransferase family 4 protein [Candidatus Omnitrophota bacterium]